MSLKRMMMVIESGRRGTRNIQYIFPTYSSPYFSFHFIKPLNFKFGAILCKFSPYFLIVARIGVAKRDDAHGVVSLTVLPRSCVSSYPRQVESI